MKEIKLRIYDKMEKKIYDKGFVITPDGGCRTILITDEQDYLLGYFDCIIMQYTGFKDKNGVEIYEGDIIKTKKYVYEVKASKVYGFALFGGTENNNEFYGMPLFDILSDVEGNIINGEVVGNVFDNKKLLNMVYNFNP